MTGFSFSGSKKSLNKQLGKLAGVQAELELARGKIFVKAQALMADHHRTGEHEVTMSDGRVDKYVNIEGEGALALEVGHFDGYKGKRRYVEGVHVLTRALK